MNDRLSLSCVSLRRRSGRAFRIARTWITAILSPWTRFQPLMRSRIWAAGESAVSSVASILLWSSLRSRPGASTAATGVCAAVSAMGPDGRLKVWFARSYLRTRQTVQPGFDTACTGSR